MEGGFGISSSHPPPVSEIWKEASCGQERVAHIKLDDNEFRRGVHLDVREVFTRPPNITDTCNHDCIRARNVDFQKPFANAAIGTGDDIGGRHCCCAEFFSEMIEGNLNVVVMKIHFSLSNLLCYIENLHRF